MRVGFIGLGTMGGSMALNAQKGGHEMVVHDLRREAAIGRQRGAADGCELGAGVLAPARVGLDQRRLEAAVHRVDQQPGAAVAHPHRAARGRDRGSGF